MGSAPSHKSRRVLVILVALAGLVAAGAGIFLLLSRRGQPAAPSASAETPQAAPASIAADPGQLSLPVPESDLAKSFAGAQRLMEKVPTDTYDVAAASRSVGADIERAFAFVRDRLGFDPYVGCQRGAQGALMTRAGNDIDRSLLLAALLKGNGHAVRLVQGRLGEDDAARLLLRARQAAPPAAPVPAATLEDIAATSGLQAADLAKLFDRAKSIGAKVDENIASRVRYDTSVIKRSLEAAGIPLSPGAALSPEAVRHHVWVQTQTDDGWQDLDASFADAKAGQKFAELEGDPIEADALPDDWYQRVRVRILSVAPGGGKTSELMNQRLRVADLLTLQVGLAFLPQDGTDPLTAFTFQPTLIVAHKRLTGTNIDLGAPKRGGAVDGLFGALSGADEEPAKPGAKPLPRILLEVTLEGPGMAPERATRVIADTSSVQDPARRLAEMRDQLITFYQFVVAAGPIPREWAAGQLMTFLKQFVTRDEKDITFVPVDLINVVMAATSDNRPGGLWRRYYARPLVVAQRLRFRHGPDGTLFLAKSFDILHNRAEFLSGDALAAIQQGVLETELERAALPGTEVLNTTVVFERTQAPAKVLRPGDTGAVAALGLSEDAKARIVEDLAAGYAVIAPPAGVQIAGMPASGWWRVRPDGGETLGRMQSGEGQSMTEYAMRFGPGAYSLIGGAVCKYLLKSNTGGCNPCLLGAAGLLSGFMSLGYFFAIQEGTFAVAAWQLSSGAGGIIMSMFNCAGKAIQWGQDGLK